ncbi:hypothetical protein KI387_010007, partial [Taxus chinensis]
ARSTVDVLMEMLITLDPVTRHGVKEDVIMDLVEQLQHVLAKHDVIASGSYNPSEETHVPSLPQVNS